MDLQDEDIQKISDALVGGRKIEAIKIYRQITGLGLKESKEYIDALTTELKETYPESFQNQKQGCAAVMVIGALIVAGAGYLLYPLIT